MLALSKQSIDLNLTMEQKRMRYQKFLCEAVKYPAFIYATKECSTSSKMYG